MSWLPRIMIESWVICRDSADYEGCGIVIEWRRWAFEIGAGKCGV